jgi:2-oxo-4-hydroxy-4-carboxy-5-ureidoimidazoline decarboxylase
VKRFPVTLRLLSKLDKGEFVRTLGCVFEHSTWVAEMAWERRPFVDLNELHSEMVRAVLDAGTEAQLSLIRAHPQLAGREAQRGDLTDASLSEQGSAGLAQCSPEELARLHKGNAAYLAKFGFPFVMAVKYSSRSEILAKLEVRLQNARADEFSTCLTEIGRIARYRLEALFAE